MALKLNDKNSKKKIIVISTVLTIVLVSFGYRIYITNHSEKRTNVSASSNLNNLDAKNKNNISLEEKSIIDKSSPIAQSKVLSDEKDKELANKNKTTYIGDIVKNEDNSDVADLIDNDDDEPSIKPPSDIIKDNDNKVKDGKKTHKKKLLISSLDNLKNSKSESNVRLDGLLAKADVNLPSSGALIQFVDESKNTTTNNSSDNSSDNNSNKNNLVINKKGLVMAEAYNPYSNRDKVSTSEFKVTLGSQFYATMAFSIVSDDSGPALAKIEEGPLKGAKLQGTYSLNTLSKAVNIQYNKMSFKGQTYQISAIAYNLETQRPVMADSVDNHYMERFGGLFMSAFVKGYADTLNNSTTTVGDSGNTTTINNPIEKESDRIKKALGEPATEIANVLKQNVNRPITVYVNKDRSSGVYFLDDLTIKEDN